MRRIAALVAGTLVAWLTAGAVPAATAGVRTNGDWLQYRFGATQRGVNPFETELSPSTIGQVPSFPTWNFTPADNLGTGAPVVAGGVVFVRGVSGVVDALNASTGSLLWSTTLATTQPMLSMPLVTGGSVQIEATIGSVVQLVTLNRMTGDLEWEAPLGSKASDPVVAGGAEYVATSADAGTLAAWDAASGRPLWKGSVPLSAFYYGGAPTVADGDVFQVGSDGVLYAFAASGCGSPTCPPLWTVPNVAACFTRMPAANGLLFVQTCDDRLVAIRTTDGSVAWSSPAAYYPFSSPAVAGGVIFQVTVTSGFAAVRASDGAVLWHGSAIPFCDLGADPTVANGVVFIGNQGTGSCTYVFALDARTGTTLGSFFSDDLVPCEGVAISHGWFYVGVCGRDVAAWHLPSP
jgi:outer membrane protein assembly factor BamB